MTLSSDDSAPLFGSVPPKLFGVFARRSKYFYADLLAHLAEDPFGQTGEIATRKRVQDAIGEFIDRQGRAQVVAALADDAGKAEQATLSHLAVYDRLIETSWLVEYRDRYRRVVDFDPAARLVLHVLLDIKSGRARAYGGAVLNVLTLLQSVENDARTRALNVREAALAARGFMNHLRTVAGTMRRVEALIMAQSTAAALVRRFVADFIEALVVQDYRNLHARESPYRFRGQILEIGEQLLEDDRAIREIAEGWIVGGIAKDSDTARHGIVADLRTVIRVFASIDDHVKDIETTTYRIERRMTNVVRFSDRMATVSTDRILHALDLMRASKLLPNEEIGAPTRLQLQSLPLGQAQLYLPPRRRTEAPAQAFVASAPDPALLRYLHAIDEFETRISITPQKLERYVEQTLGDAPEAMAEDFPVSTVEEFLMFERLHEAGLGSLSERYSFHTLDGVVDNGWVERRAFVLKRREVVRG